MHPSEPQRPWTLQDHCRAGANLLGFTANMLYWPVVVWTRSEFGSRYFGFASLFSLIAIPAFVEFFPEASPRPLMGFWWGYVVMLIIARLGILRRRAKGDRQHTLYSGYPRLCRLFPRLAESSAKAVVEPALVRGTGVAMLALAPGLGFYLIVAALAEGLSMQMALAGERVRFGELNDAMIEQQQLAARFHALGR